MTIPPLPLLLLADLVSDLPPAVRLQRLVRSLRAHFSCNAVALLKLEQDALRPVAVEGLSSDALGRRFAIRAHPRLAAILASREPTCFQHTSTLPDPYDGLVSEHAALALPVHDCMGMALEVEGERWGVITFDALDPGTFDEDSRVEMANLACVIEAAVRVTSLEAEVRALRVSGGQFSANYASLRNDSNIVGQSQAMLDLLHELQVVADSELPVLLLGETGVGKELFAHRLHRLSRRFGKPLVHVNCAALPEALAESELFGHVRGAFSGAVNDRAGRFEAAEGGTLFLDEVGELSLPVQAKLLRALQNGEIQRLGADQPRWVDVRVIAATNRKLADLVRAGVFRADLYHRLSVYPVLVPPLRERGGDVLLLAGRFLELNRARLGLRSLRLAAAAEDALRRYHWPGNVRELEHVISRAALKAVSRGAGRDDIVTLQAEMLDLDTHPLPATEESASQQGYADAAAPAASMREIVEDCQRQAIRWALTQQDGNWAKAARQLDVDASNLHKLARRLGVKGGS